MKILVLANSGMGLYKFRRELLEELLSSNYEVYISVPDCDYVPRLVKLGCEHVETYLDRRGMNPISDLRLLLFYISTLRRTRPDLVLTYTIKPNVYGGIACRITDTEYVATITGLGTPVENGGILSGIALTLLRIGLRDASCVFFQNEANRQLFVEENLVQKRSAVIPGSGVNLRHYNYEEYPDNDETVRFLFIGRIMRAKGIDELLQAAQMVKAQYASAQFHLVGACEEDYLERLVGLEKMGTIKYHGHQDDVKPFIKSSHAIVLPSYHEGTSNVLLESASSGRPVLASMVPGCLETFDEGVSGFGFEAKNVQSLVDAIMRFIRLPYDQKRAMGMAGRKKMEAEYDRSIVVKAYIDEIHRAKEEHN